MQAAARSTKHASDELTLILNTYRRPELLRRSVRHFSQCPAVARIHVNWAESTTPPNLADALSPALFARGGDAFSFALPRLTNNDSSLNTRFLPIAGAPCFRAVLCVVRQHDCIWPLLLSRDVSCSATGSHTLAKWLASCSNY